MKEIKEFASTKLRRNKTVGESALDLMQKEPEVATVIDQQRAMQEDYLQELVECVQKFKKDCAKDFFITVLAKSEKLLPNVFRNYFVPRHTCPTPNYDQTVFRYCADREDIEFIWAIPCREACFYLRENALQIPPDERDLLQFVISFSDGTLYKLCRHLNDELEQLSEKA